MKRLMGSWHHYEMTHPPFLTSKEAFCTSIVGEVSLSSRMRSMQSFIFYQWTTQPPPLSCFHGILALWSFCPQATNCSPWGPSISCLKSTKPIYFEGIPKGTLAKLMFWNHCISTCACMTKWIGLTKGNLEYQWPLRGIFLILELNFLIIRWSYIDYHGLSL